MIAQGKVRLDQPIAELLPPETGLPKTSSPITLKHLTTHSAGLPHMPPNYMNVIILLRLLSGLNPYDSYTDEALLAALGKTRLEYQPGQTAEYSNYTISLLGWILSHQAGGTYEDVILQEVCKPLGMANTAIMLSSKQKRQLARGYSETSTLGPLRLGRPSAHWHLSNAFAGAGALRSSPADMMKYLKANMGSITNAVAEAMQRSHEPLREFSGLHSIGMNWFRRKAKEAEPEIIWHNGGTGGYRSFIGFTADKKAGVVVLCGVSKSVDALGLDILKALQKQVKTSDNR